MRRLVIILGLAILVGVWWVRAAPRAEFEVAGSIKPLVMKVPARLLTALPQQTGVLVVSPDGSTPLYSALYDGDALASVASAIPSPGGIYLANEALGAERQERNPRRSSEVAC